MSEYTNAVMHLTTEFYRHTKGNSDIDHLISENNKERSITIDRLRIALTLFDMAAFHEEQQERKDKGLKPTYIVREMVEAAVDYLQQAYVNWGKEMFLDDLSCAETIIEILTSGIVIAYIDYYGDDEFYINDLGQVRKRESAVPEANKPQRNKTIPTETDIEKLSLPEELNTAEAKDLFSRVRWCKKDGGLYKWIGTAALFGYFTDKTSDYLGIRPSNDRVPWSKYKKAFQMNTKDIDTARQAVNGYKNQQKNEPEGFLEIKKICEK